MEFLPLEINGKKVYAGFWRRFGAGLIDFLLILALSPIFYIVQSISISIAMVAAVFWSVLFSLYVLYFHYKYGATFGKAALGIRLSLPNGGKIGLTHSLVRSSIDLAIGICTAAAVVVAIGKAVPEIYLTAGWRSRANYLETLYPAWYEILGAASVIWLLSEIFVVLLNKRKRAIHDFMAGTVVINQEHCIDSDRYATLASTLRFFYSCLKR
jgi:uncharacterized RDD family membrane protein YckC